MKKKLILPIALMLALLLSMPTMAATVCKIGSKGYSSLQAAVNAVKDGQTIKVTKAIKTNVMVDTVHIKSPVTKFTIDFTNKKYTYSGYDYAFLVNGPKRTITFKNINFVVRRGFFVGGWGPNNINTLIIKGGTYSGGSITNRGVLKIQDGKYTYKGTIDGWINNYGTMGVVKGTFDNCNIDNYGTCTLKGGTWSTKPSSSRLVQHYNHAGKMTIYGGKYTGGNNTLWVDKGAKTIVKAGTFNVAGTMGGDGSYTISGGTFNGNSRVTGGAIFGPAGKASITGGTFNLGIRASGNLTINDGTCSGYIVASGGGKITINKMTVNTKTLCPNYKDLVCLIAEGGTIRVNGGSFTAENGYGYTKTGGGIVSFGVSNLGSLFHVKAYELKLP